MVFFAWLILCSGPSVHFIYLLVVYVIWIGEVAGVIMSIEKGCVGSEGYLMSLGNLDV